MDTQLMVLALVGMVAALSVLGVWAWVALRRGGRAVDAALAPRHSREFNTAAARVQRDIHGVYNRVGPPPARGPLDVLAEYGRLPAVKPQQGPPPITPVRHGPVDGLGQVVQWPPHNPRYDTAAPRAMYDGRHRPQWPVLDLRLERQPGDTEEFPRVS